MSINGGMDKEVVQIYNGILLSHKKEWNNAICSNMGGPRHYHTKWSKSKTERQILYNIIYMQNLKYDTNELIYKTETQTQRLTDTENRLVVAKEEGLIWSLGLIDANYDT